RAGEARTGGEGEVGAEGGRALVVVGVLAEAVALARAVAAQSDTEAAGRRGRLHVGAAVAVAAAPDGRRRRRLSRGPHREDVDGAADGARPVKRRAGPAHDL